MKGGHTSCINVNIERPHKTIKKMFNMDILDSGHESNNGVLNLKQWLKHIIMFVIILWKIHSISYGLILEILFTIF